ncbi:MAG: hypothetical protein JNL50_02005 [Phycisphaerae bacterium]|nr:hypothetical protein [Phycisphaerae bacterium]
MNYSERSKGSEFLVDCNVDNADAAAARRALSRGDFDAVELFLESPTDPNERFYAFEAVADWPHDFQGIEKWAMARGSAAAVLASGIQHVKAAWDSCDGKIESATPAQARAFMNRMTQAAQLLSAAMKDDRADATVFPWLIWAARSLDEKQLVDQTFDLALKRGPSLRAIYSSMLVSRTQKWGGSREQALDFARQHAAAAPRGIGIEILPVEAHFYCSEHMEPASDDHRRYWGQEDVASDVLAADDACRSLPPDSMNTLRNRHWLAYALWLAGLTDRASAHFDAIGEVPNQLPWRPARGMLAKLRSTFRSARKECLESP